MRDVDDQESPDASRVERLVNNEVVEAPFLDRRIIGDRPLKASG